MRRDPRTPRKLAQKITFGVLIMGVGVLFFLHNFHLMNIDAVFRYWPLLFAVLALGDFIGNGILSMKGHTLVLLTIGLELMSLERYDLLQKGWPLAVVYLGIIITLRALFPEERKRFCHDTDERQS